jgi:hypothetical protein
MDFVAKYIVINHLVIFQLLQNQRPAFQHSIPAFFPLPIFALTHPPKNPMPISAFTHYLITPLRIFALTHLPNFTIIIFHSVPKFVINI